MAIDVGPLGAISDIATAAKGILGMFFPDKTEEEKSKIAAAFAMIQSQTNIDQAEAQSADPLQHWRGGLGWVCTIAYAWTFIFKPMLAAGVVLTGHAVLAAQLPSVDMATLGELTLGMLGLGGMHVYQQVNGK
jgi:Holin of 3TMs, for gene-transfer release